MYIEKFLYTKLFIYKFFYMKDIKALIETGIKRKGYTKALVYNEIGKTQSGFEYALKNSTFSLEEFDKIAKLLNIEPNYFFDFGSQIDINQVNEPLIAYRKVKNYENKMLKTEGSESETIKELLKQNTELIAIIKNLTK